jgi:hypothetical protein
MTSIARTPMPGIPYTFTTVSASDDCLDARARRNFQTMHLPVIADASWPGLRHAARMDTLLRILGATALTIGLPLGIAGAAKAWIAFGVLLGILALAPIVALTWHFMIPTVTLVFDWRARTLGESSSDLLGSPAIPFDAVRLEVAPVAHGHVVWARTARSGERVVGFFPTELVATAFRDRLATMLRDKRYDPSRDA